MRSIRLLAATTVIVTWATACGDNGTDVGNPPVANFTAPSCTAGTPCQFTDASTPADEITSWSWNFGDNTPLDTNQDPVHTFATANSYTVTLTVTSANGSDSHSNTVVVTGGTPTNVPPTAAFTVACTGLSCVFNDGSSDSDGAVSAWSWNFGDGSPAVTDQNPTHTYAAAGAFTVTLTVTDDDGATGSTTQTVTVSPPTSQACTSTDVDEIDCALTMTQRATLRVRLTGLDCEIGSSRVFVPPPEPAAQTVFTNVCFRAVGAQYTLLDNAGAPLVFATGELVHIRFQRGPADPPPGSPQGNVVAGASTWTINIDDGGNPGGPGEPDFNDVVLTVEAIPAP
jgi:PKD repeat protein